MAARPPRCAPALVVAALALTLGFLGGAQAQTPADPAVTLALPASAEVDALGTTELRATLTNGGSLAGSAALDASVPEGWTVEFEPPGPYALAAGASQPVRVRLIAPDVDQGAATGRLALAATLTDTLGRSAAAQAETALTRVDPILPPAVTPWYRTGTFLAAALLSSALATGGLALVVTRRNAQSAEAAHAVRQAYLERETGIDLAITSEAVAVGGQRELGQKVVVRNLTDRPRVGVLEVVDKPVGWRASFSITRAMLNERETRTVTLHVQPAAGAPTGSIGSVVVSVKPAEAQDRDRRVTIHLTVPDAARTRNSPRPNLRR